MLNWPAGRFVAMANDSIKACAKLTTTGARVITALALASSILIAPGWSPKSLAADFRHAKKIIVPASAIPRRYDYTNGMEAVPSSGSAYSSDGSFQPGYGSPSSAQDSSGASGSSGSSGLVPPPPPSIPTLLPSGYDGNPAPSSGGRSRRGASAGKYQQTFADPTRDTSIDRHILNSELSKATAEDTALTSVLSQANSLIGQGKLADAQDLLEKYNHLYPHSTSIASKLATVSVDRARYYMKQNDPAESAKQARLALSYDAHNTEARTILDQVLKDHGVDSKDAISRVKIGDLLFSQGKFREAKVEYDAALKSSAVSANGLPASAGIEKTLAQAHVGLGNVLLHDNKLKEAKLEYQHALEKDPASAVAFRQRGLINYKLKDLVAANQDFSKALVLDQEDKTASHQLIELWQRQVSANPKDANAHMGLARAYQLSNDLKSAQNEYRTVVSIDPNHPNLPAARESFKLALSRQEAMGAFEAAKTLETHGALSEAYQKAGEAVSLSPSDVKFKFYQAELAERLGHHADAKQHYLEVLRQDPKNALAAQRIKALNDMLLDQNTLRGPIGVAPSISKGKSNGRSNGGFSLASPGSLLPVTSGSPLAPGQVLSTAGETSPGSILGTPRNRGEGPPLPTLPPPGGFKSPSPDGVNNLSGFLVNLRDYLIVQKKQLNDASSAAQGQEDKVLENLGLKSSSSALGDLPSGARSVAPLDLPKGMITSGDVSKLLAGIKGKSGKGESKSSSRRSSGKGSGSIKSASSDDGSPQFSTSKFSSAAVNDEEPPAPTVPPPSLGGGSGSASSFPASPYAAPSSIPSSGPAGFAGSSGDVRPSEEMTQLAPPAVSPAGLSAAPYSVPGLSAGPAGSLPGANQMSPQAISMLSALKQKYLSSNSGSAASSAGSNAAAPGLDQLGAGGINPQALIQKAQALGLSNQDIAGIASQVMKTNPDLVKNGLSNLKQEDVDNAYKLLKNHIALQQQVKGGTARGASADLKKQSGTQSFSQSRKAAANPPRSAPRTVNSSVPPLAPPRSAQAPAATSSAVPPPALPPIVDPVMPSSSPPTGSATPSNFLNSMASTPGLDAASNANALGNLAQSASASLPKSAAAVPGNIQERLDQLEAQNKALLSQLENNQKQLHSLRQSMSGTSAPDQLSANALAPSLRGLDQPLVNSVAANSSALAEAAAPALELAGVNVRPTGVRLNVVMRNLTNKEISVPDSARAIVRMNGLPDQFAKLKLSVKKLAPGAEAKGFISISGHKIDPSADVFVPNLFNTPAGPKDVHLSVPISSLIGQPQ